MPLNEENGIDCVNVITPTERIARIPRCSEFVSGACHEERRQNRWKLPKQLLRKLIESWIMEREARLTVPRIGET